MFIEKKSLGKQVAAKMGYYGRNNNKKDYGKF